MHHRHWFLATCIITATISTLTVPSARAAKPIDMDRIVVTPTRGPGDIATAPRYVTVIDADTINSSNALTIPQILRTAAGVMIRDYTGTGKNVNVDMRGFGETGPSNLLVLVDGRRVNAVDLSNTDWSQISLSQVERIEILRGASSVLYGDNASAGVINIITKQGDTKPYVQIEQRGGSYNTRVSAFETAGLIGRTGFRLSAEYADTRGYRENSDLRRRDIGLQLSQDLTASWKMNIAAGYHADDYRLPGSLSASQVVTRGRRASTRPQDEANSLDTFVQATMTHEGDNRDTFTADISYRLREVDAQYVSSSWRNENSISTFGFTPRLTLRQEIAGRPNTLIIGADFYTTTDNILDGAFTGANDKIEIAKNSQGIYVTDQIQPTENLTLQAGFRKEMARYRFTQITQVAIKEKSSLSDEAFETGVIWSWDDDSRVYLDYSTSFRYPLVDEFFASDTWGFGGLNSSLSTQRGNNIEAGARHRLTDTVTCHLNAFWHDIENEIFFDPLTFQNANYDKTLHHGIETEVSWQPTEDLRFLAHYTYTRARFGKGAYKGNSVPAVPEHKASFVAGWAPIDPLQLNMVLNYVGSMFLISDQANAYSKMDEYVTVDLRAGWTWREDTTLYVGINNIFDAEYSEYGIVSSFSNTRNFFPAPGRNVIAGCRVKF